MRGVGWAGERGQGFAWAVLVLVSKKCIRE